MIDLIFFILGILTIFNILVWFPGFICRFTTIKTYLAYQRISFFIFIGLTLILLYLIS